MDVIDVMGKISVITDRVFPKPGSPHIKFAACVFAQQQTQLDQPMAKMAFDQSPAIGIIMVTGWQPPNRVQVFRQHHDRVDAEWFFCKA